MIEFVQDLLQFPFLQYALLTGILASVACGVVGSFITVRRITYIAGAIAHTTFGGMGAAIYLQRRLGLAFITPLHGAVFAALLAALIIGMVTLYGKQREDTVLSAVWAIGMALGIFFISRTPGYKEDLMSYLFGNILMVRKTDLVMIGALDLLIVVISFLFYYKLEAVCFDETFARLRGVRVRLYYVLLLCMTALTIVILLHHHRCRHRLSFSPGPATLPQTDSGAQEIAQSEEKFAGDEGQTRLGNRTAAAAVFSSRSNPVPRRRRRCDCECFRSSPPRR
jgi:zinc transport system permease protein